MYGYGGFGQGLPGVAPATIATPDPAALVKEQEALYFDVGEGGILTFKSEWRKPVLESLDYFMAGDPATPMGSGAALDTVILAPLDKAQRNALAKADKNAIALNWVKNRVSEGKIVAGVRWLVLPTEQPPRFLAAFSPYDDAAWVGPNGWLARLAWPGLPLPESSAGGFSLMGLGPVGIAAAVLAGAAAWQFFRKRRAA